MAARQSSEPGVNAMRFALMFTVVMAHAWWLFGLPLERSFATFLLLVTAQSSVPAFFITSGYFLRWRDGSPFAVTRWVLGKLIPLYLLWMAIYAVVTYFSGWGAFYAVTAWHSSGNGYLDLLHDVTFGVTTRHLWFLPALAAALSVTSISLRFLGERLTWVVLGAIAALGLLTGPYQMFLGYQGHAFRALALTSPLLVMIGVLLASRNVPRWAVLFGLAAFLCYWLQVFDDKWLATAPGYSSDRKMAVTLATIPFALSVFLFARALPAAKSIEWLSRRKHYLLIIYCIHPMMLTAIRSVWDQRSLPSMLSAAAIAYLMSCLAAVAFDTAQKRWREFGRSRANSEPFDPPEPASAVTRG